MRATWPGARSGRISITTSPWVVSRIRVFWSLSVMVSDSFFVSSVDEWKDGGTSGHRIAEPLRKRQRRAGVDGLDRGALVQRPGLGRRLTRHVGEARLAEKVPGPREGEHDRHVHAGPRLRDRRQVRRPADREREADVVERVEHRRPARRRRAAVLYALQVVVAEGSETLRMALARGGAQPGGERAQHEIADDRSHLACSRSGVSFARSRSGASFACWRSGASRLST